MYIYHWLSLKTFQPTLPARGATYCRFAFCNGEVISTHAPRTGSDAHVPSRFLAYSDFNPRSPHGERRVVDTLKLQAGIFQPTLPARGATLYFAPISVISGISTHAPRTGSDAAVPIPANVVSPISTHAPRTGSDFRPNLYPRAPLYFNPRSPHGERR